MVQIEDDVYEQLKKNADDNRQIVKIVRLIIGLLIFSILFGTWGIRLIDLDVNRRSADLQAQIAIAQAKTNKQVMEIESEGLSNDEYFTWLRVRQTK